MSADQGLQRPRGHDDVLDGLFQSAVDGRMPHAVLLSGAQGIGKFLAARWLAAGLLCERGPGHPCEACGPCKRVRAGSHPDLFVVDSRAAGQDRITIHFVARRDPRPKDAYQGPAVEEFLMLRADEGGWKIVIVREAERMHEEAQNAFLKTLEEPRPRTLLLLESSSPGALLSTVRSRLVTVALEPLADGDARAALASDVELAKLDEDEREMLLRLAAGAPGRALRMQRRGVLGMRAILGATLAGELAPHEAAARLWDQDGDFPGKTEAAQRRLRAETFLDLGLEVLLDIERARAGVPAGSLAHGDLLPPGIGAGSVGDGPGRGSRLDHGSRRRRVDAWLRARQDVLVNLSPEALIDRALAAL